MSPEAPQPRRDAWFWILALLALGMAANAAWMLADPARWYSDLPAAVPDTGPYNEHFVRDIGCAFATVALALAWAALRPSWRAPLVAVAAVFLVLHALLHVFDTVRGFLDADHWWLDLPGVYLPAVLLAAMSALLLRGRAART
jgi:hypothetical protein